MLVAGLSDAALGRETAWIGSPDFVLVRHLALVDPQVVLRVARPKPL